MLKAVYFVEKSGNQGTGCSEAVRAEISRAVRMLTREGFRSGVLSVSGTGPIPHTAGTLLLCDSGDLLRRLRAQGHCVVGYSHADNPQEHFPGAAFVVQEPDLVDPDSYIKMYEREAGLPWTILRTPRCLVREFTVEDLDAIYDLYDDLACCFLEPPSEDRCHEREILRAYIDRIYSLYGFGHWAVIAENTGKLIGRVGFAALTAQQEAEALSLGVYAGIPAGNSGSPEDSGIDADFGFLICREWRRMGIAEEVCTALLQYGFSMLGFTRIRADARTDNSRSCRLLEKLGFVYVGTIKDGPDADMEAGGRRIYILDRPCG